jgi:hypothetical protein
MIKDVKDSLGTWCQNCSTVDLNGTIGLRLSVIRCLALPAHGHDSGLGRFIWHLMLLVGLHLAQLLVPCAQIYSNNITLLRRLASAKGPTKHTLIAAHGPQYFLYGKIIIILIMVIDKEILDRPRGGGSAVVRLDTAAATISRYIIIFVALFSRSIWCLARRLRPNENV